MNTPPLPSHLTFCSSKPGRLLWPFRRKFPLIWLWMRKPVKTANLERLAEMPLLVPLCMATSVLSEKSRIARQGAITCSSESFGRGERRREAQPDLVAGSLDLSIIPGREGCDRSPSPAFPRGTCGKRC